jgi:hypothetical protein
MPVTAILDKNSGLRPTILLTATIMNAVLYAILSFATAYIQSPLGSGQFRPAVVIPALFASVFGPLSGGIGAALGTLIADSVKHGQLYPGSYLAAVPGNFIGFYLFGLILKRKFSWRRFIIASEITLTLANAIVAFLYVFLFKVMYLGDIYYTGMSMEAQVFFSLGLTIWFYVTMLPFVLIVTPLLIRAVASAFPSFVPDHVKKASLREELPTTQFSFAILVPGLSMLIFGLATSYSPLGSFMISYFKEPTSALVQLMFLFIYVSGAALTALGVISYSKKLFVK